MRDYERAILLLRNPLNAIISYFNDYHTHDKNGYASLEVYKEDNIFTKEAFIRFEEWKHFHDMVLQNYKKPLLVIQYEQLKSNYLGEMEKIFKFLGFSNLSEEIESCLLEESIGHFKRKKRPKNENDEIDNFFSKAQLDEFHNTYKKFLKYFQTKLFDSCKLDKSCQTDIINIV